MITYGGNRMNAQNGETGRLFLVLLAVFCCLAVLNGCLVDERSADKVSDISVNTAGAGDVSLNFAIRIPDGTSSSSISNLKSTSPDETRQSSASAADISRVTVEGWDTVNNTQIISPIDLIYDSSAVSWSGTIENIPADRSITFIVRAYDSSPTPSEIFKGETVMEEISPDQTVSFQMVPAAEGEVYEAPAVPMISYPGNIYVGQRATLAFVIQGTPGETFTYRFSAVELVDSNGKMEPSSGTVTLREVSKTTVYGLITAPTVQGIYPVRLAVENSQGASTTVDFSVSADLMQTSALEFNFLPVTRRFDVACLDQGVTVKADVTDDRDLSGLTYSWRFRNLSTSSDPILTGTTSPSVTLLGYQTDLSGELELTIDDNDAKVSSLFNLSRNQCSCVLNSNMTLFLPFDDGKLDDISGFSNHAVTYGDSTTDINRHGHSVSARYFDGDGDYLSLADSSSLSNHSNGLTLALWAKPAIQPGSTEQTMISLSDVSGSYRAVFSMDSSNGSLSYNVDDNAVPVTTAAGIVTPDEWAFYVVTHSADRTVKFYKNGEPVASGAVKLPLSIRKTVNTIGKGFTDGTEFKGSLDDIRMYTRNLTDSEIKKLYYFGDAHVSIPNGKVMQVPDGKPYYVPDNALMRWTRLTGALIYMVNGDFDGDGKRDVAGINRLGDVVVGIDDGRSWYRFDKQLRTIAAGDFMGKGSDGLVGITFDGTIGQTSDLLSGTDQWITYGDSAFPFTNKALNKPTRQSSIYFANGDYAPFYDPGKAVDGNTTTTYSHTN